MEVTLIQCTNSKRNTACKARKLYDASGYFQDMKAYAEAKNCEWYILSAKHEIVHPEIELEPYDAFGLSIGQCRRIADWIHARGFGCVELVAGRKYTNPLAGMLEDRGVSVVDKFDGLGIGKRRHKLQVLTRQLSNKQLC